MAWSQLVQGAFVRLPGYPWQREHYWIESEESRQDRLGLRSQSTDNHYPARQQPSTPGWSTQSGALGSGVGRGTGSRTQLAYLDDHRVQRTIIYPGAGYIEMALAVAAQSNQAAQLTGIIFHKALPLPEVEGADDQTQHPPPLSGDPEW